MTIQSEAEEKKILKILIATSEDFLQSAGNELNYQKITDNILDISAAQYAVFNLYEEDGRSYRIAAFSAPEEIIKKVTSLIGFKVLEKKWKHDPFRAEKIKFSTITHFSSLSEFTGKFSYKKIASLLDKSFNFGEMVFVKILKENIMLGDFILIMPANTKLKNENYVEIYTQQVGLLIAQMKSSVKLIESEKRIRSVFAAVSDPIFLLNQETGDILDVNDAACSLYGYSRNEMLKLKNIDLSAEPEKTGKALKTSLAFVPVRYHKKKDGTVFPTEITASIFELNNRKLSAVSIRDITGRKMAEEVLRKSEEKFSKAFHSGAVLMAISTVEDGCYIDVNDAFLKTLGFNREEVIGRTSSELDIFVDKKQREAVKKLFYEKGRVSDVEVQVKGRDGIVHTGIFTVEPIDLEDKPCWLTTLTEITERKKAEENLKNNTEALQNILKGTNVGTWEWNVQTGETRFNARSAEILGYTLDEISPCNVEIWERFAHPGDFKKSNEQLRMIFAREIDYQDVECRMKHKDGSWVWIQDRGKVISWTPDGKPLLMSGTYTDITGRKKAEEALRVERERLANILEGTNAGTWEWNFQTGELMLNARTAEIIGYTLDEISPVNAEIWERFAHPEDLKKSNDQLGRIFAREIDYYDGECRLKHKNGNWVWVQDRGKVISWTPDGKPLMMSGTYTDITGRKAAEKALEESNKTIERYLNIAVEIILSLDTSGNITMLNESGHKLLGYNYSELIGKNWFKTCLPNETVNEVSSVFEKIINGNIENVKRHENKVKTNNGEIKTILWHNTLLKDSDGNITGIISSGEDITDRKKAEDEIIYLSFHDHLTGLYNRRFFEEELKRLDTERQLPLSFVMGDLNGLKLINDVFGHTEGDKLLKETAEILRRVCRSDDILTRWGGDEFVLLLPKTSASGAEEIVERIKKECKKTKGQKISISLSLGIAIKETAVQDIQTVVIDAENNMYKNKLVEKESLTSSIIFALEQALYEKSNETKGHTDRIHDLAIRLGKSVKLSSRQLDELSLLAALHDIGKVAIPENILLKKSTLTEKEWKVIKRHPEIGFNIAQSSSQIAHIAKPILYCHENWDGSGYPMGISGESIPVISRIILIADAYDVMTSIRTYKLATSKKDAITELKRCAGSKFDPALVDKFIEDPIKKMTIQNESEEKKVIEKIVAASEEFLQSAGSKINYQKITDTVIDISGAKYAVFSLYDEGGNKFITTAISAPEGMIKKVSSLLGFKLLEKKWDYDQVRAEKTKSSTIVHFSSLLELTGDAIPKPIVYLLEKTLNAGEVVFVKILKENTMIGDFTLIMPKNVILKNDNYLELYSRQLGLLITRKRAEEALLESEEKFRDLAQMLPETVFEINVKGILTFVNQRAFEKLGYTRQDFDRGINALDMLIPEDRERAQKKIAGSFRGENKGPNEYIAQRTDGSTFPILLSSSVIIRNGKAVGLRGLIFDITERKRAEEALQESKETIERYLNIVAEIIISLDRHGNITMINESGYQLLGYNRDELIGRNWFSTCLPDEMISDVTKVFEKIMNGDIDNVTNYENAVKIKSGEIRTIFWHNTTLKDSNGNVTGTISSGEDITERKKAEDLLHMERERLANILEGTNAGTWEWNIQTKETVYNERWADIIGYKLAEISPVSEETWERFTYPGDIEKSNEQLKKVFSREINYYDVECRMRHKDGSCVWVQDRGKVMSWTPDGKPLWMSGTHTDITERKLSEEALQASEEKFSKAFETSSYAIAITRLKDGKFVDINEAFTIITGFTREEVFADSSINLNLWVNIENRDRVVYMLKEGIEVKNEEFEFRKKNGTVMIGLFSAQIVHINNEPFIFSSISDITDRKKAEAEILHLSFHDHLTGLYNRRFFEEELKRLDTERQLPISFIMGDLNGLKIINDVFGHNEGDRLLKVAGEILKTVCRSDDILARWGGDEFVILLPKTFIAAAEDIADRIKKECKKTNSQKIPISLSLGSAAKESAIQDIRATLVDAESNMYKNKLIEKQSLTSSVIFALEQALYEKSNETKEHTDRIHELAGKLGKSIRLSSSQMDELSLLASLHDIGKVAIPETILLKKGKLTEKEWSTIKRHPEIGFNIAQSSPQIAHIAKPILYCHENFDGSGYPMGIRGHSIPVISRIILIVDSYDVMTSGRSYRPAMNKKDAITEIKRNAGSQFDPALVDAFIKIVAG